MITKHLIIDSYEKYDIFLCDLWLYRSWLFGFVTFDIKADVNQKRIKDIETALNIKSLNKRIKFVYDRTCDIIDEYNKENHIECRYTDGICEDPKHQTRPNGCCCHCYLQSSNGCTSKNLSCKFYFCDHMWVKYHPLTVKDIDLLLMFTPSQRAIIKDNVFVTEKTYLRLLKIGSYGVMCIYSILKLLRMKNI